MTFKKVNSRPRRFPLPPRELLDHRRQLLPTVALRPRSGAGSGVSLLGEASVGYLFLWLASGEECMVGKSKEKRAVREIL